ncbi:MAG: stage V sporulation T C-terminal domain-containing protein [Clostridia bacterium]|nr:stage V sporulation T C-terminal domain-containing protein [Clostridia bacterium]
MVEKFNIAGYCRISVDEELDRDNTSIENQKSIISEYVKRNFPGSTLTFYEDRDRSGYTFEQREGYQEMRPFLMKKHYDILIVKDFSRFSRRNSRGLVELEDLRDAGVRIISIGDSIDYPTYDDWTAIQFRFLVNEMPVTDASKKVKSVIKRRQEDGKWICAVPYGYVITNTKTMAFEVEPAEAEVVRKVFDLYIEGWGYKKIANYLTEQNIPTPRMNEVARKIAKGEVSNRKAKPQWSIATIQGILQNDFYIGTLRQGKYTRKKINGEDVKKNIDEHLVFENHHEAIVDYKKFKIAEKALRSRTTNNYRGVKKYDNIYSGLLVCGDCKSPMFPMSRKDLKEAYRCGAYHQRGVKACSSHHIKVDELNNLVKIYLQRTKESCADLIAKIQKSIENNSDPMRNSAKVLEALARQLEDAKEELKILYRQKTREIMRHPEREEEIEDSYDELITDAQNKIKGYENQILLSEQRQEKISQINRFTKVALDLIDEIIVREQFNKHDLDLLFEKIYIYEDHIEIDFHEDIDSILKSGVLPELDEVVNFNSGIINSLSTEIVQTSKNRKDKVYDVNVISNGDPLEIYTGTDGDVIFKKYSPMGEMQSLAEGVCAAISQNDKLCVAVFDRERCIAASGSYKKELLEQPISSELEPLVEDRRLFIAESDNAIPCVEGSERSVHALCPIIAAGDIVGCICLTDDLSGNFEPSDIKLIQIAAAFLGSRIE